MEENLKKQIQIQCIDFTVSSIFPTYRSIFLNTPAIKFKYIKIMLKNKPKGHKKIKRK
jgi:hypothetical protein